MFKKLLLAFKSFSDIKEQLFVFDTITELHYRYEMSGQASKDKEPWDLVLLDLESRGEYYRENPLQILCQMLLESYGSLKKQNKALLNATLLQGINSESILMKNMTLKAMREVSTFSPGEILSILLDNNLIYSSVCKEQVFLLMQVIYTDLTMQERVRLLDAIENLKMADSNDSDSYEIYNWYIWLQKIDSNNDRINKRVKDMQENNGYKPRGRPEAIMDITTGKWIHDESPLSEEDLTHLSMPEVIDKLKNYHEDPFFGGPSRRGLLETVSITVSKNKDWSNVIIHSLIDKKINKDDIWQYIFYGLQKAEYELADVWSLLLFVIQNINSVGYIYGAADCVWKILQRKDIKSFFVDNEMDFYSASEILWEHRKQEKEGLTKTVELALNTTVGCILFSWIYMVSLAGENTIPDKYKEHFEKVIELETWERNVAVCVLAGYINFFFYRDMEWSKKTIIPFFKCDNKELYVSAWEGMVYFSRRINKDTVDILAPVYYSAIKHIEWLEADTIELFIELLLTLMIYVVEKPTLKYIPEFYKNTSEKERILLIRTIEKRLRDMEKDDKIAWWNAWLKRFLENRKNNKPRVLEDGENEAIIDLLTVLPEVFEEAVDIICKGKMPGKLDDVFWSELSEMDIATEKSHSMAKFLTKALKNVSSVSLGKEDIRNIVSKLQNLEAKESKELNEVLLKWDI